MNRLFIKFRQDTAQHSIEHMTMIILIMAGIIIGGPYVIRSWNAHMKGWEDSVTDSLQDPIKGAPSTAFPVQGCDPNPWWDGGCGAMGINQCTGAITTCDVLEKLWRQTYNPDGCQCGMLPVPVHVKCTQDPVCCMPWTPALPTPANDCGVNATPPCPDGNFRQTRSCGQSVTESQCTGDPACLFSCNLGAITFDAGRMSHCRDAGQLDDETGLSSSKDYDLLSTCTATKCEIICLGDLTPNITSTGCECAAGTETWNVALGYFECI